VLKAVIDTNIWVSALITAGRQKELIDVWLLEALFVVVYPSALIIELRTIDLPKIPLPQ
jgi:predicted nucleic acid-binding protein